MSQTFVLNSEDHERLQRSLNAAVDRSTVGNESAVVDITDDGKFITVNIPLRQGKNKTFPLLIIAIFEKGNG